MHLFMNTVCLASLEETPDFATPPALMPQHLRGDDNTLRLAYLKEELVYVVENKLSESQKNCIVMHYWQKMRRKDIADSLGIGPPQVTKNLQNAEKLIREHMEHFESCCKRIERELIANENCKLLGGNQ